MYLAPSGIRNYGAAKGSGDRGFPHQQKYVGSSLAVDSEEELKLDPKRRERPGRVGENLLKQENSQKMPKVEAVFRAHSIDHAGTRIPRY